MQKHVGSAPFLPLPADPAGPPRPFDWSAAYFAARRQIGLVGAATAGGVLAGAVFLQVATPQYTATAQLLIDGGKDKTTLSNAIADLAFDAGAIDSQVEVMKSQRVARAVLASSGVASDTPAPSGAIGWAYAALAWLASREPAPAPPPDDGRAVARLLSRLEVRRVARTYVLSVAYTSPDRASAAALANSFAQAYLTEQLQARDEAARRSAAWMQARLSELKRQSLASDLAIQKFKAAHGILVTGGDRPGLVSDQRLSELNAEIVAAQGDTARAEARFRQIDELLRSGRAGAAVPDSLANPVVNDLRSKYLAASKTQAQLETKLGPSHRQVLQLKREMAEYNRLIADELRRIAESYRSEMEVARARERALTQDMAQLAGQSAATDETLVQLRELQREADSYRALYESFLQRYQDALQKQSFPETQARVITQAAPPDAPSFPRRGETLAFGALVGVLLGSGLAALRETRDVAFRTSAQVKEELGLAFLGCLPLLEAPAPPPAESQPAGRGSFQAPNALQRYSLEHPDSSYCEALRAAKIAVDLTLGERSPKIVGVVSLRAGEGKSTVAKNLASLIAALGLRTLLIDADLRNPSLSRALAGAAAGGLNEVLRGECEIRDALVKEAASGLFFIPALETAPQFHSSQILSSSAMQSLLDQAGRAFPYIVLDLPPIASAVDVRAAEPLFDALLLVVEWGRTPRALAHALIAEDEALSRKCVGVLFNKVDLDRIRFYERDGVPERYASAYPAAGAGRSG